MSYGNQHLSTDSIYLEAARKDSMQSLLLHAEMADLNWSGRYKITEIKQALEQTINHYYKIPGFIEQRHQPAKLAIESLTQTITRCARL